MLSEAEFNALCEPYRVRMAEFMSADRDYSTATVERELEFVQELLAFMLDSKESAPAHFQAQIAADIERLTGTAQLIAQALFCKRASEAEAMAIAQNAGAITIQ
jgi:molybdopterin biosynthesis enzyme